EIKYYEAGMDLGLSADPYESFRLFQGLIRAEYDRLVAEFGLVRMDATLPPPQQQQRMRGLGHPHLHPVLHQKSGRPRALAKIGLQGHYLQPAADQDEWQP